MRRAMLFLMCSSVCLLAREETPAGGKKEPAPPVIGNHYELRSQPYASTYLLLRFERFTGKTWTFNTRWQEIEEIGKIPSGKFDIHIIPLPNATAPRDYRAIRIETETGVTWMLQGLRWEEMKER